MLKTNKIVGIKNKKIIIAGDSSGGNLAMGNYLFYF